MDKIIFNLKRFWAVGNGKTIDLYEEIKSGRKTIEYRDCTRFWSKRLCGWVVYGPQELTDVLKVHRAWFVVGYPKNSLPRLEADIIGLRSNRAMQLEIEFTNVREIIA